MIWAMFGCKALGGYLNTLCWEHLRIELLGRKFYDKSWWGRVKISLGGKEFLMDKGSTGRHVRVVFQSISWLWGESRAFGCLNLDIVRNFVAAFQVKFETLSWIFENVLSELIVGSVIAWFELKGNYSLIAKVKRILLVFLKK